MGVLDLKKGSGVIKKREEEKRGADRLFVCWVDVDRSTGQNVKGAKSRLCLAARDKEAVGRWRRFYVVWPMPMPI